MVLSASTLTFLIIMILLFSVQSRFMRDKPCAGIKVIFKMHYCLCVQTFIKKTLLWYLCNGCSNKEVAINTGWASDLGSVGVFFPNADSFFFYDSEILLFCLWPLSLWLFWFNPSRHLSPFNHLLPPSEWDGAENRNSNSEKTCGLRQFNR